MCCFTHGDPAWGPAAAVAGMRCLCGTGGTRCIRQATAEDLLCDICAWRGPQEAQIGLLGWQDEAALFSAPAGTLEPPAQYLDLAAGPLAMSPGDVQRYIAARYAPRPGDLPPAG